MLDIWGCVQGRVAAPAPQSISVTTQRMPQGCQKRAATRSNSLPRPAASSVDTDIGRTRPRLLRRPARPLRPPATTDTTPRTAWSSWPERRHRGHPPPRARRELVRPSRRRGRRHQRRVGPAPFRTGLAAGRRPLDWCSAGAGPRPRPRTTRRPAVAGERGGRTGGSACRGGG